MRIKKHFKTIKQATKHQNGLYNHYNSVELIIFPLFGEEGVYVWKVSDEIKKL